MPRATTPTEHLRAEPEALREVAEVIETIAANLSGTSLLPTKHIERQFAWMIKTLNRSVDRVRRAQTAWEAEQALARADLAEQAEAVAAESYVPARAA